MTHQVPRVILQQLGGNKFLAMTGAYSLTGSADALSFRLPGGARNGAMGCRITLNGSDLYDVWFGKIRKFTVIDLPGASDVPVENLVAVFESMTGLATQWGGDRSRLLD